MNVDLPRIAGPAAEAWPLLFELAVDHPNGWVLAGAQMVIVHAAAHNVHRPLATEDTDVLVDVRALTTTRIADWLRERGFQLGTVSPDGIGHRFRRHRLSVDVLAIDHAERSDRTTVPPARTIMVPGGRRAVGRATIAAITSADHQTGVVPVPDWLGAVLLKARAATAVVDHRSKHLQDLALLLSLPVDVPHWVSQLAGRDRRHLRDAASLLDDAAWRAVSTAVDVRVGHAARALLTGAPSAGR